MLDYFCNLILLQRSNKLSKKNIKIGIVQCQAFKEKAKNIENMAAAVKTLAEQGANVICLQELFASEYFCFEENHDSFDLADEINDEIISIYSSISKENNVVLIASLFEKRAPGLYHNTTIVTDNHGKYLGMYRKNHIPDDPGFYEKFYFTPGDLGYKVFDTDFGKIGTLICWDQWYPEAARATALKGADILFYPTAIGWDLNATEETNIEEYNAWKTMHLSHAVANGVHVVAVNRIGVENGTKFWGGSVVSNPFGTVLFQGSHENEELKVIEIDLNKGEHYRRVWPYFRDRRIDTYSPLLKRFDDEL